MRSIMNPRPEWYRQPGRHARAGWLFLTIPIPGWPRHPGPRRVPWIGT